MLCVLQVGDVFFCMELEGQKGFWSQKVGSFYLKELINSLVNEDNMYSVQATEVKLAITHQFNSKGRRNKRASSRARKPRRSGQLDRTAYVEF